MSELLQVASALRRMSDEKLANLITERMINSSGLVDFFDLAEALTKPTSISAAIAGLPLSQALELRSLAAGQKPNPKVAAELAGQMLISGEPEFKPFEATLESLATFAKLETVTAVADSVTSDAAASLGLPAQDQIDRDCGIEIFETMQAITELIFDLEHRFVREVGKKNVGLPDIKRFATHLRKTNEYAKQIYELAHLANLIMLANGRWQLSGQSQNWLDWNPGERFEHLAKTWRQILGDASAKELQSAISKNLGVTSLEIQLAKTYPFADGSVSSKITKLETLAGLIGLSANGWMSSWAPKVLKCEYSGASKQAAATLPQPQDKLICQADLTLIAPGPLPTDIEITLRRFADTEQIGMASTYRLSALSISHGLETGLALTEIRELLVKLSGNSIPQPIEYLLNEAESRFGRLKVIGGELNERTIVQSTDKVLLAEILNDTKLKPFALSQLEDGQLASRFEPEVLYFGLREIGFVAIRVASDGKVISPLAATRQIMDTEKVKSIGADILRLREQDAKLGDSPDDDDLQRQIQLAIKNKTRAKFTVTSGAGEIEFLLEPIGIANGRLRAKDRKADIERTLPITSIIRVVLD
ncbi:MAG: hypothetical protein RLZ41_435 [Actinomycetota bacterium]